MSSIAYRNIVMRSTPMPNASPVTRRESYLTDRNTFGCTIPAPRISSHPVDLHVLQDRECMPPPQITQDTSTSSDGSVNGKKDGRNRRRTPSPKIDFAKYSSRPFRSLSVTPASTHRPST